MLALGLSRKAAVVGISIDRRVIGDLLILGHPDLPPLFLPNVTEELGSLSGVSGLFTVPSPVFVPRKP